jgi:hypothetical protein
VCTPPSTLSPLLLQYQKDPQQQQQQQQQQQGVKVNEREEETPTASREAYSIAIEGGLEHRHGEFRKTRKQLASFFTDQKIGSQIAKSCRDFRAEFHPLLALPISWPVVASTSDPEAVKLSTYPAKVRITQHGADFRRPCLSGKRALRRLGLGFEAPTVSPERVQCED